jgi:hypothetical protein
MDPYPAINIYSETRQANGEWTADNAITFTQAPPRPINGWVDARMVQFECPWSPTLYSLLADGVFDEFLPWSIPLRGMPRDMSPEVAAVCESSGSDGFGHSHLTGQELAEKYIELLLLDPNEVARARGALLQRLDQLINNLMASSPGPVPLYDRRIVFWFETVLEEDED